MTNNLFLNFSEIDEILEAALNNTHSYLSTFRNDAGYSQKLETAFGTGFDRAKANSLFDSFAQGNFGDIPSIEIVNRNDINGANGAFSITTGKIYLAADFISQNAQNTGAITAVLLEEIGHSIDAQINVADAAGDEGDVFARLVQGESLSEQELAVLQAEDDTATVTLDGQVVQIEQNSQVTFYDDAYYGGLSFKLGSGNHASLPSIRTYHPRGYYYSWNSNDKISSLKIPAGLSVRLYEYGNFQGRFRDYTGQDIDYVGDFNDLTSSIQVIAGPSIEIFQHQGGFIQR